MDRLLVAATAGARLAGKAKDKADDPQAPSPRRAAAAPGVLAVPPPPPPQSAAAPSSPSPSSSPSSAAAPYSRPKRAAVAASVLSGTTADAVAAAEAAAAAASAAFPLLSPAETAACNAAAAKMRLAPAGGGGEGDATNTPTAAAAAAARSRALVVAALTANPLLRDLAPAAIDAVADSMRPRCVPFGRDIITQGDKGARELFVLESGAAEVWVSAPQASSAASASAEGASPSPSLSPPEKVLEYGPGASFGELALMYNAPRAATVRAVAPKASASDDPPSPSPAPSLCRLWVADRAVVATVRRHWAARDQASRLEAVSRVRAFADLGEGARSRLAEALRVKVLAPGEPLFSRGEAASALFVVRSGSVVVGDGGAGAGKPVVIGDEDDEETEGVAGEGAVLGAGAALRAQEHEAKMAADAPATAPSSSPAPSSSRAASPSPKKGTAPTPEPPTSAATPSLASACRYPLAARAGDQGAQVLCLCNKDLAALLGGAPLAQVARCEALRRCAALAGAGDARLWALARRSETKSGYGKGDVVFRAGDVPDCFYVVIEGTFECRGVAAAVAEGGGGGGNGGGGSGGGKSSPPQQQQVLATVGPGQCFGERGLLEAAKEDEEERLRLRLWQEQADKAAAAAAAASAGDGKKKKDKAAAVPAPPPPPPKNPSSSSGAHRQATVVCVSPRGRLVAVGRAAFASLAGDLPSLRALWREGALRRVPLFDALSSRERAAVAAALRPIEVRAGEAVVVQGERGDHFFVVERGVLDAYRRPEGKTNKTGGGGGKGGGGGGNGNDDENDDEDDIGDIGTVVRSYGPGDYFGELALLSERALRAATVVARADASLLALGSAAFSALLPPNVRGAMREAAAAYTGRRTARPGWPSAVRLGDLEEVGVLGCGGFGRVSLVRLHEGSAALAVSGGGGGSANNNNNNSDAPPPFMALKAMWKSHIVASQLTAHVHRERDTMLEVAMATASSSASASSADNNNNANANANPAHPQPQTKPCPWLVTLHASFADDRRVYLLMDACTGGELFSYLRTRPRSQGPLSERDAKFYVAGVALALKELHARSLVYRDLKPENVLLTSTGYPRLADFGFVKRVPAGGRTHTLCGTPEYLAPELVERRGHWQAADWWALGVLAYELSVGSPPFYARDPVTMYAQIREAKPRFPQAMSPELRDFCARLLHRTPALRLGAGERGAQEVLEHAWFGGFDWEGFEKGEVKAPYVPPPIVVAAGGGGGGVGGKANYKAKMTAAALAAAAQAEAEMAASGLAGAQYRDAPYESQGDFADF